MKVSIEVQPNGRAKLNVDALGALGEPKSLRWPRKTVEKMLPKIDLPDLLFRHHRRGERRADRRPDRGADRPVLGRRPAGVGGRAAVRRPRPHDQCRTVPEVLRLQAWHHLAERRERPGRRDRADGRARHAARLAAHPGRPAEPGRRGEAGDGLQLQPGSGTWTTSGSGGPPCRGVETGTYGVLEDITRNRST